MLKFFFQKKGPRKKHYALATVRKYMKCCFGSKTLNSVSPPLNDIAEGSRDNNRARINDSASVRMIQQTDQSVLLAAAEEGNTECLAMLLRQHPYVDVNCRMFGHIDRTLQLSGC